MRKALTDTVYGKDDTQMLANVLKVSDLIGWIALPVLCAGIYLIYRIVREKDTPAQIPVTDKKSPAAVPTPQPPEERKVLTDEYLRICRALDTYRDRDVFRELFSKVGTFIQLLLGSRRRFLAEGNSEELLEALDHLARNLRLNEILTAEGFQTVSVPSDYDEVALRRLCEKADLSVIRSELAKKKQWLKQYRSFLDCKSILTDCAFLMHQIVLDVQARNTEGCFAKAQQLEQFLQSRGCYSIFWEDSRVAASESMRVDFREDQAWATELPGLYTQNGDGSYHRIGALGGTVRRG